MTHAEGRTPPRVHQPGKGQRVEVGKKKGRRGVGYSESISAHTTITTTKDSGHDVHSKCMRNESAVCLPHACVWKSRFLDVICVVWYVYTTMHNEQSRTRAKGLYVDHPK